MQIPAANDGKSFKGRKETRQVLECPDTVSGLSAAQAGVSNIPTPNILSWKQSLLYAVAAGIFFNLAYSIPACSFLIAGYLWCLFELTRAKSNRQAYHFGTLAAALAYAPQTGFFWNIFGAAAIALLYVLVFWVGLFVVLGRLTRLRLGNLIGLLTIPFLWTGLEYFRSELYYLRFSWFNEGYVFSNNPQNMLSVVGGYGVAFVIMAVLAMTTTIAKKKRLIIRSAFIALLVTLSQIPPINLTVPVSGMKEVRVAGVQLETPSDDQVIHNLDKLVKTYPDAELLVLSEYTFLEPVPESVRNWCRKNKRYLVVGAEDPVSNTNYYDTAFVIGPTGEAVFKQAKSVPIQFFKDGLPAKEQTLWNSPWGKIGFCICYDLSYTRVTDRLIELGAQALIVPTMDLISWGEHQHELHARVAPTRAAEYGVSIFRMASSGISQHVDSNGHVLASAPMPGDEATLYGKLQLKPRGHLPMDRYLAPLSVWITGLVVAWLIFIRFRDGRKKTANAHR